MRGFKLQRGTFRFWWVCNCEWKSERAERDISVWHWIHVLFVRLLDKFLSPRWYFIHKSEGPAIDLPINDKRRIAAQNHGVYITSTIRENIKHFERVRKRDGEGEMERVFTGMERLVYKKLKKQNGENGHGRMKDWTKRK